jgi:hypothetical protein
MLSRARQVVLDGHFSASGPPQFTPPPNPPGYRGHAHFWERALSRRQVLGAAASGALLLGAGLPRLAAARVPLLQGTPKPIPFDLFGGQGPVPIHVDLPYYGNELSTLTDFIGFVAAAEVQGEGTGTTTATGATTRYTFDADMRVIKGLYVGENGQLYRGTFGFI